MPNIIKDDILESLCAEAQARSLEIEAARALPADFADKLRQAGLLAMFAPEDESSPPLSPIEAMSHLLTLARYDAATAWVAMIGSTASFGGAYMPPDIAASLVGRTKITCGIFAPNGTGTIKGDDYIVSGRWAWASGSANADTIGLGCRIISDDKPEVRLIIVSREQVIFHDTWHTLGLRGTSSGDVELKEVRVPKAHSYNITQTPFSDAPLYKMPYFGLLAMGVSAVALGNAQAALDAFTALAVAKTPAGGRKPLAQRAGVQAAYGEVLSQWRAAHSYYTQTLKAVWQKAQSDSIDEHDKTALRLAATYSMKQSLQVVRRIHDLAGGTAVYDDNLFQKYLRDSETMSQHMIISSATYEMSGKALLLGADPHMQL